MNMVSIIKLHSEKMISLFMWGRVLEKGRWITNSNNVSLYRFKSPIVNEIRSNKLYLVEENKYVIYFSIDDNVDVSEFNSCCESVFFYTMEQDEGRIILKKLFREKSLKFSSCSVFYESRADPLNIKDTVMEVNVVKSEINGFYYRVVKGRSTCFVTSENLGAVLQFVKYPILICAPEQWGKETGKLKRFHYMCDRSGLWCLSNKKNIESIHRQIGIWEACKKSILDYVKSKVVDIENLSILDDQGSFLTVFYKSTKSTHNSYLNMVENRVRSIVVERFSLKNLPITVYKTQR